MENPGFGGLRELTMFTELMGDSLNRSLGVADLRSMFKVRLHTFLYFILSCSDRDPARLCDLPKETTNKCQCGDSNLGLLTSISGLFLQHRLATRGVPVL